MLLSVKFYFSHYQQKVEVSVFPSQVHQLYFEKEFTFIDQLGDLVTCYAKNFGDYIESVTTGGRGKQLTAPFRSVDTLADLIIFSGGQMRTFMQIVNNQLFLTSILEDKNNVKAVRIFEKQ